MSANEVLLPPWVIPQAESTTLVDDSTSVFRAAYAPGNAQRVSYVEPRLQVKQTFQGLRGFERGAMLAAIKRAKGKLGTVRAIVGYKNRGSFPITELFANNDFSNGLTSWSTDAQYALSALDHGIRATRAQVSGSSAAIVQSVTLAAGIPYCLRGFINGGKGADPVALADFGASIVFASSTQGMLQAAYTVGAAGSRNVGFDVGQVGIAGNFFDAKWTSLARCAQVDNGQNSFLNSDTIGTGTGWSLTAATAGANGSIGPDGATDAWAFAETTANSAHSAQQNVTVGSAAQDFTVSAFVLPNLRSFCYFLITEATGGTTISAYYNLGTGAISVNGVGANFALISQIIVPYGNGWFRVILTFRKTNAATTLTCAIGAATAAGTASYLGSTSAVALVTWRASFAQSSVPVSPVQTTSSAITGTSQIGNAINVKGLPISTSDNLLEDDLFEINGELKSAVAPLSSDAAGLGTLFFAPSLCRSPSDGDGVIINKPMGKFILAADSNWTNNFGVYADSDITLEAINE